MIDFELYRKINNDLKTYFTQKLSQEEALPLLVEKYKVNKQSIFRLKVIIATGYCILRREGRL
jgi:hypothetical protein